MTRAVDVGATVEAGSLVEIKLPRLRVVVEQRQAERLRDALNAVLPERIEDLMHDPRISDVDVLQAAQVLLAERGQDTENLGVAIEHLERQGVVRVRRQPTGKVGRTLRLLTLWEYVDPEVSGPYANETERTEAAQDYRRAHGEDHGVFRMDVTGDIEADVLVRSFTSGELEMLKPPAALSCERCGSDPAPHRLQGVALCQNCDQLLIAVAVGDRVRDPQDGTWREVMSIDPCGTVTMRDGGCMSLRECVKAETRLPSESLPCPACEAWADGGRILTEDEWHAAGDAICGQCRFAGRTAGMHS